MVSVFTKMAQAEAHEGGDRIPGFLRTHPHSGDRWARGCQGALAARPASAAHPFKGSLPHPTPA